MIRILLKISLFLLGYFTLGIGLLILFSVFKMLFGVLPEIVIAQGLGFVLTFIGFWMLGKYEKLFKR